MGNIHSPRTKSFFPSPVANSEASDASHGTDLDSNDGFFCCKTLLEGSIASANFTTTISMLSLMLAFKMFFMDLNNDNVGTYQILAIAAGCYSIFYIVCSRKLIQGIQEERVDKFKLWIGISAITVIFLFADAFYVLISYSGDLQTLKPDPTSSVISLLLSLFLALLGSILIYCIWGVVLLFKAMSLENASGDGV